MQVELLRAAQLVIETEGFRSGELSIAVVGDRAMARLHERHSGVRGTTDVLTFDLGTRRRSGLLDGEIIVCRDAARRVARRVARGRGRPAGAIARLERAELALYVVHGVLHLAGFGDKTAREFERMHAREDELLQRLGLGRVFEQGQAVGGRLAGQMVGATIAARTSRSRI